MRFAGYIFDFDGVVADSFAAHKKAWQNAYKEIFGYKMPDYSKDNLTGKSSEGIAEFICSKGGKPEQKDTLLRYKTSLLFQNISSVPIFPGIEDIFKSLNKKNCRYGIASNASGEFVRGCIDHYGINCRVVLGAESFQKSKPSPEPFIICADKCGIKAAEFKDVVVFEDTPIGIKAGVSAGMKVCAVKSNYSAQSLIDAGAHYVSESVKNFFLTETGLI